MESRFMYHISIFSRTNFFTEVTRVARSFDMLCFDMINHPLFLRTPVTTDQAREITPCFFNKMVKVQI